MSRVQDKQTTERNSKTLRELVKRPENKVCADCKRNDPRWASWNIGVFVCIRCSGIHRSMGTHISKVKSVDLDMWTPEQMANIIKWGNARANAYWEAHLKAGHVPPDHKIESFIRSKYESKRWAREGPPPEDPSVLDGAAAAAAAAPAAESALPTVPAVSPPPSQRIAAPTSPGVVNRQPAAQRSLLSEQQLRQRPAGAASPQIPGARQTAPPPAPAPVPAPAKPADDIFSLDFNAPPSAAPTAPSHGHTGSKDVKQDIMSLFSKPTAQPGGVLAGGIPPQQAAFGAWSAAAPAQPVQPQPQQQAFGAWGAPAPAQQQPVFNAWGAAQPVQPVQQQQQQQQQTTAFGAWASAPTSQPAPPAASNVWGAPASAAPATGGGAFGSDIWGSSAPSAGAFGASPSQPAKKDDAFGDLWSSLK